MKYIYLKCCNKHLFCVNYTHSVVKYTVLHSYKRGDAFSWSLYVQPFTNLRPNNTQVNKTKVQQCKYNVLKVSIIIIVIAENSTQCTHLYYIICTFWNR